MPEFPEVNVVIKKLEMRTLGKTIKSVDVLRAQTIEGDIENSYKYAKRAYNIDKNDENLLKHIKKLPYFDYNI